MNIEAEPSEFPEDMPFMAVLGLRTPADSDWAKVRALQRDGMSRGFVLRIVVNLISAILLAATVYRTVDPLYLGGWMAVLALVMGYFAYNRSGQAHDDIDPNSVRQLIRPALNAIALSAIWATPVFLFAAPDDSAQLLNIWTILSLLMAVSALLFYAMPLSTLVFITLLTGAAMTAFAGTQNYVMFIAAGLYGAVLVAACIQNARNFVKFHISKEGLDEKGEVVSLLLREFEESGADWLWQINSSRRIVHVGNRFAYALGREPDEIEGKSLLELLAGDGWETGNISSSLADFAEKLKRRESFSNLIVKVQVGGQVRWWELSASPKLDERGVFMGFRGVGSDVTEQRESADKISHMARFDTLTGLPNRLQVTETLAKSMQDAEKRHKRCGFMMIDLDRFKSVNDTLGHLVGDRLLAHVSQRLRALMNDNELCGRLGGDEFAVVVRDASDQGYVKALANRIIESLSRPYLVDQHKLYIGASIGTAIGPRDGKTVEMIMRNADLALYRSKDAGGGQFKCYEPQLHVHAEERRVMEIALRSALEKKELSLNYQPVVVAETGGVQGFEALLRWNSKQFGSVSPVKFIPIAEEARLIFAIGEWVMHEACMEAMNWPSTIKIAVNVSAEQLGNPKFMDSVLSALQKSGLPAQRLEIEVTESIFLHEGTGAIEVLDEILALGIGLSLDDFGTGYSSLGYLRKTRFSTIKVDRSFVQGAAKNVAESLAIIRAVVAMADSLGMATTAEGAETQAEVDMIRKLGCNKIQGYFYGRPMAASDAVKLFSFSETNLRQAG